MPAGSYSARIEDAFEKNTLSISGLSVSADSKNEFYFELVSEQKAKLEVSPASPIAGSVVTVNYSEAPKAQARITVVPLEMPDDIYLDYEWVDNNQGSVELTIPIDAAELEARFLITLPDGGTRVMGRSAAFTSVAALVTLDAPAEVAAGSDFEVNWVGPNNGNDTIVIANPGSADSGYLTYAYTSNGSPATLTAPETAGTYEIRYRTGQGNKILARLTIIVK